MVEIEDLYRAGMVDWYRMTAEERWNESARLRAALAGLDAEPQPPLRMVLSQ